MKRALSLVLSLALALALLPASARAASSALGPPSYSNCAYAANSNRGYATGTESAEPGWAMVGENGPELMFFNRSEERRVGKECM